MISVLIVAALIVAISSFLLGAMFARYGMLKDLERARVRAKGRDQLLIQDLLRQARGRP